MNPKIKTPCDIYVNQDNVSIIILEGEWHTSMSFCPHESFLGIKLGMKSPDDQNWIKVSYYLIYLRWRHKDPWKAMILRSNELFEINYEAVPTDLMIGWNTDSLLADT